MTKKLHGNVGGRRQRLVIGVTAAAALAMTLEWDRLAWPHPAGSSSDRLW